MSTGHLRLHGFESEAVPIRKEEADASSFLIGAGNRTRTGTLLRARDFKSLPLSGSIYPELDNFGLFRPDKMRKLRQIPKLSNFNRHQKTAFIFLLIPPFSPCFAMVFCNLEGCWRDGKMLSTRFGSIQQK